MTTTSGDRRPELTSPAHTPDRLTTTAEPAAAGSDEGTRLRRRGQGWLIAGFAVCPCHLPFTLAAVGTVIGGTAVGDALTGNPVVVGVVLGTVTVVAYVRGLRLLRAAERCSTGACPSGLAAARVTPAPTVGAPDVDTPRTPGDDASCPGSATCGSPRASTSTYGWTGRSSARSRRPARPTGSAR
jgi:hypothetical protein